MALSLAGNEMGLEQCMGEIRQIGLLRRELHPTDCGNVAAADRLRIELFDGLRVQRGPETIVRFRSQKTAALLAYLALFPQRRHPREQLAELIWGDCTPSAARHNLSNALSALRVQLEISGACGEACFEADRAYVRLTPGRFSTDAGEFEETLALAARSSSAAERVPHLQRAVALYQGELLRGHYEDWIFPEQSRLATLFARALDELTDHVETTGDRNLALQYAERAAAADPLSERVRGRLMRLYAAAGQEGAALSHFRAFDRLLRQELDAAPSPELRALAQAIAAGQLRPAAAAVSPRDVTSAPAPEGRPAAPGEVPLRLEPVGGAVPLHSPFYVPRGTDQEFHQAIRERDSIVLVKGPRQTGKTSLLARGLQQARESGTRVVLTDLQAFSAAQIESHEALFFALAESLADGLELSARPRDFWDPDRGPGLSLRRFLRQEVLGAGTGPLVWAIDEVDRLFGCPFSSEVFGVFRSWHNERALAPEGPWHRLTLALAYATEAHLLISDLSQSPFNVGTRLELRDFDPDQVASLNERYGMPLGEAELPRFLTLLGGHPLLVRRALHEMARRGVGFPAVAAEASQEGGLFGDHLRRLARLLQQDSELAQSVQAVLHRGRCPDEQSFYRLRSAGVLRGEQSDRAELRCQLYREYLLRQEFGGSA